MGSNTKAGSAAKIKMESFDDLFGGNAGQENGIEQIINAPLAELHTFKDHPFRVEDDEKMEETTESIRQHGVLVPGIARPRAGGGYEIIAGHRRKRGSELAGKTEMPVIVRNYTDDEATIIMVDSNIQREDILPSEKARAYKMKYEAMKHQGKKSGRNTLDEVGEAAALVNKNWTLKLYFFTYNLPLLYSRICFPVLPGCKISQRICRPFFVEKFYICSHFFLNIFSPQVKISK